MTPLWTSAAASAATGGYAQGVWQADGIAIDSRSARIGDLFVALPGSRVDGHDYVASVLAADAAAALVNHRPADVADTASLLLVDDVLAALGRLAAAARDRARPRTVAVTGSVGKTGSKDALAQALAAFGAVHASAGNLNNHIGVPLSLARMPAGSDYAVFEIGMNHAGEIGPLSRLVRPEVALITTVAPAHIGFFDTERDIALAKAEIFEGLGPGGVAVLNHDNRWFTLLRQRAVDTGIDRIVSFGTHADATVQIATIDATVNGTLIETVIDGRRLRFPIDAVGAHWGVNAVGVLACIHALGLDVEPAAAAMRPIRASRGRGGQVRVALATGGCLTLIDESYNASPAAMRAAFGVLGMARPGPGGRRVAVLADMLELGDQAAALHAGLVCDLLAARPDLVITTGPLMQYLRRQLPAGMRGLHEDCTDNAASAVAAALRSGDVVLVKGSLGSNLAPVVKAIEDLAVPDSLAVSGGCHAS